MKTLTIVVSVILALLIVLIFIASNFDLMN
jgi:hypothetical protein